MFADPRARFRTSVHNAGYFIPTEIKVDDDVALDELDELEIHSVYSRYPHIRKENVVRVHNLANASEAKELDPPSSISVEVDLTQLKMLFIQSYFAYVCLYDDRARCNLTEEGFIGFNGDAIEEESLKFSFVNLKANIFEEKSISLIVRLYRFGPIKVDDSSKSGKRSPIVSTDSRRNFLRPYGCAVYDISKRFVQLKTGGSLNVESPIYTNANEKAFVDIPQDLQENL